MSPVIGLAHKMTPANTQLKLDKNIAWMCFKNIFHIHGAEQKLSQKIVDPCALNLKSYKQNKIEEKKKNSQSSSKVVGLRPADECEFPTLVLNSIHEC